VRGRIILEQEDAGMILPRLGKDHLVGALAIREIIPHYQRRGHRPPPFVVAHSKSSDKFGMSLPHDEGWPAGLSLAHVHYGEGDQLDLLGGVRQMSAIGGNSDKICSN
jgi:hypothetical protein